MKRRVLLSAYATTVVGGCLASRQSNQPRLAWIWLLNDRDKAYEFDVVVENNSETVFSELYSMGTEPDTANRHIDNPVDGPGQYVVHATVNGETRNIDTTEYVDGEETCIGVRFSLLNNGSVDHWTKLMQKC